VSSIENSTFALFLNPETIARGSRSRGRSTLRGRSAVQALGTFATSPPNVAVNGTFVGEVIETPARSLVAPRMQASRRVRRSWRS
jgi:hypothetical protein